MIPIQTKSSLDREHIFEKKHSGLYDFFGNLQMMKKRTCFSLYTFYNADIAIFFRMNTSDLLLQKLLHFPRSQTLGSGREKYLRDIHSWVMPGSCQMVPTWAYRKVNVCIMHFGWDLNHCNMHLAELAERLKQAIDGIPAGIFHGNIAAVPGISDGIANGSPAMRASLVSRDNMTTDIINHYVGTPYHGIILIPGCDKNIPAAAMSLLYTDEPWWILCGGSIHTGANNTDIVSVYQASGKKDRGEITHEEYESIHAHACPWPGACGGMYTANSMFTIFESMGLTPLYGSSTLAEEKVKTWEHQDIAKLTEEILIHHRTPSTYITKGSFENAVRILCILWGSTNPVLHLLAMAESTKNWKHPIIFTEEDIERISKETPFLANLAPNGEHRMQILSEHWGTPAILRYMLEHGHLDWSQYTLTGKTLSEELMHIDQDEYMHHLESLFSLGIMKPFESPYLDRGHLIFLTGNIGSGWTKVSNAWLEEFRGKAVVFESETDFLAHYQECGIMEGSMVVIRNMGPKRWPGMPEMLTPTSKIIGAYGMHTKIGLMTDARFSGGSVGGAPIIGHIDEDKGIALIENGDMIRVDPQKNLLELHVSPRELENRRKKYVPYIHPEVHIPMPLRQYARGNPNPRSGSLSIEF